MNNDNAYNDSREPAAPDSQTPHGTLARWLQEVMYTAPSIEPVSSLKQDEMQLELLLGSTYHLHFFQQLPDFIIALLTNDEQASVRFAPLLFHLAGCSECHSNYLDLYDAMRAAIYPQGVRPLLGQGTRTLAATPQRMLGHLCRTLVSQAEAILRHGRREHVEDDAAARTLLQLALRISALIHQSSIRQHALHDLVRVATFNSGNATQQSDDPHVYSYTSLLAGAGGARGKKIVRRADTLHRAGEQPVIYLQARGLEGSITQREDELELHLQALHPSLRNHHVVISVPLGSLLEPIRWQGGNPLSIRSTAPVDETGAVTTVLGTTELRLSQAEERSLLEAMFMLLEVRRAD